MRLPILLLILFPITIYCSDSDSSLATEDSAINPPRIFIKIVSQLKTKRKLTLLFEEEIPQSQTDPEFQTATSTTLSQQQNITISPGKEARVIFQPCYENYQCQRYLTLSNPHNKKDRAYFTMKKYEKPRILRMLTLYEGKR